MNILDEHNEYEPKEITLDFKVYKKLLENVADYPKIMKQLTEQGTHVLLKSVNNGDTVYALAPREKFEQNRHRFNEI